MPASSLPEISIARHAVQAMLRHALDSLPAICCGLLAGSKSHVQSAMVVPDTAQVLSELQKKSSQWVGFYRSNSNPDDILSELDSTSFGKDGLLYLAISLDTDGRLDTRAYQLHDNNWREVPLVLEEDAVAA